MNEHKAGNLRVEGTQIELSLEPAFSTLDV
jgi:hypothetical protein